MPKEVIEYFGHSSFRIFIGSGKVILLDPFIEGNTECPIKIDAIDKADIILVTHGAFDHLGQAIALTLSTGATLISGPDVRAYAISQGVPESQTRLIIWGAEIKVKDVRIRSLKADHLSFVDTGNNYISSIPMSFMITTPDDVSIYAMGDSAIFLDLQLFGQLYRPQVGLIPVGGYPGYLAAMSPREAAMAAAWLGLSIAIPIHYTDSPDNGKIFHEICEQTIPQMRVEVLNPGKKLLLKPGSLRR